MLVTFVRLTLAIAAILAAFMLLAVLVKIVAIAILLAALAFGGLFVVNFIRALWRDPVSRSA